MPSTETDLTLQIGANAAGVTEATSVAKDGVAGLIEAVNALTEVMTASAAVTVKEEAELKGLGATALEVANQIKEAKEAVTSFGEAMIAAFAVEEVAEFASKMGEAAEKTIHAAETFGMTTGEVQQLGATFTAVGASPETLNTALMRIDRSFAQAKESGGRAAEAFAAVGISTQGSYTNAQLLQTAIAGFQGMESGPAKVADAMLIFGRNVQGIAPLLGMTKDEMADLNAKLADYGVVSDDATQKAGALGEAHNMLNVAMMGLNNTLSSALAPAFTGIVDDLTQFIANITRSYNEGGVMKGVLDSIGVVMSVLGTIFEVIGDVIGSVLGALVGDSDDSKTAFDALGAVVKIIGDVFVVFGAIVKSVMTTIKFLIDDAAANIARFGNVVADALTGKWDKIAGDWKAGGDKINADAKNAANDYVKTWQDAQTRVDHMGEGSAARAKLPTDQGTTSGDHGPKAKKPKAAKSDGSDDEVQEWEHQLQDKKIAANDFWNEDLAGELAFWQSKLAILEGETGGTVAEISKRNQEIRTVRQKIYDDSKSLATQARAEALASEQETTRNAVAAANAQYKAVKDGLDAQIEAVKAAQKDGAISPKTALAELQAINDQEVAATVAKINAINAAELAGLKAREVIYADDPINLKKTQDAEVTLSIVTQGQLTDAAAKGAKDRQKIDDDAAKQQMATWKNNVTSIVDTWVDGTRKMLQGTESFNQFLMGIWNNILDVIVKAIEKMIISWVMGEVAKTGATTAGVAQRTTAETLGHEQVASMDFLATLKAVTNAAVKAASAAYSAMAGIPIIGPELGAVAAGVTFVAVEAFGALASAAGGYDIPSGVNPIVQTHEEEMILPATLANPLRSMLASNENGRHGASNDNGGSGGGDTYQIAVSALDAQSVATFMRGSGGDAVVKGLIAKRRQNPGGKP